MHSFTMLTINAEHHSLMKEFHKPTDEKRMLVILPETVYDEWLAAPAEQSKDFLVPFEATQFKALA